jgi:hypothetical protein
MQGDSGAALAGATHDALRELIAGMMGAATGRSSPAPHVSLFALGATDAQALELAEILSAVFGLDLDADTVMRSPTPDALARSVETAWYEGGGSAAELADRLSALVDED